MDNRSAVEIDGQIWFGIRRIEMQVNQFEDLKLQPYTSEEIIQKLYPLGCSFSKL